MARMLKCDPPDGNHAARSGVPGFSDFVGVREDLPSGTPMGGHGCICDACRSVLEPLALATEANERNARLTALNKWRLNAGLTIAEARRVIAGFGKDEI